jgi:hypothetical protein
MQNVRHTREPTTKALFRLAEVAAGVCLVLHVGPRVIPRNPQSLHHSVYAATATVDPASATVANPLPTPQSDRCGSQLLDTLHTYNSRTTGLQRASTSRESPFGRRQPAAATAAASTHHHSSFEQQQER